MWLFYVNQRWLCRGIAFLIIMMLNGFNCWHSPDSQSIFITFIKKRPKFILQSAIKQNTNPSNWLNEPNTLVLYTDCILFLLYKWCEKQNWSLAQNLIILLNNNRCSEQWHFEKSSVCYWLLNGRTFGILQHYTIWKPWSHINSRWELGEEKNKKASSCLHSKTNFI